MAIAGDKLAQARATTTATLFLQGEAGKEKWIKCIRMVLTSGTSALVEVFDSDNTAYDDSKSVYRVTLTSSLPVHDDASLKILGSSTSRRLAIKASVNNAVTVTAYGAVRT